MDILFTVAMFLCLYFHLMHINLLTNIRMAIYTHIGCCFVCCWHPVNVLICKFDRYFSCRKICADQCFKANTIIKWILLGAVLFFCHIRVGNYAALINMYDQDVNWQKTPLMMIMIDNIQVNLILFGVQHFIFIGVRFALFIFIQLFCCGC